MVDKPDNPRSPATNATLRAVLPTVILLTLAIGLRAWLMTQPALGNVSDQRLFARWIQGLQTHGLSAFYEHEDFCDYPPLMLLLFHGVGSIIAAASGSELTEIAARVGVKALACIADLVIAVLLWLEAGRVFKGRGRLLVAGLYLLNPVSIYAGVYWGQIDAVYTALLVAALALTARGRYVSAGALAAAALGAKFQSIAVLPLVIFETYRARQWRGTGLLLGGMLLGAALVIAPFALTGTADDVFERAYVRVVGQYQNVSKNAYNLWYLLTPPGTYDTGPPLTLIRIAAGARDSVSSGESWLLGLTLRRLSLAGFALSVAVVLSLYSLRPRASALYGAAGLLALCFYLFPTEMHERYAFPAIAFLAVWAGTGAVRATAVLGVYDPDIAERRRGAAAGAAGDADRAREPGRVLRRVGDVAVAVANRIGGRARA